MTPHFWPSDEPLPAVLTDSDLMRIVRLKRAQFQRLKSEGKFDGLMCSPQFGKKTRYSAAIVQRWMDGTGGEWIDRRGGKRNAAA